MLIYIPFLIFIVFQPFSNSSLLSFTYSLGRRIKISSQLLNIKDISEGIYSLELDCQDNGYFEKFADFKVECIYLDKVPRKALNVYCYDTINKNKNLPLLDLCLSLMIEFPSKKCIKYPEKSSSVSDVYLFNQEELNDILFENIDLTFDDSYLNAKSERINWMTLEGASISTIPRIFAHKFNILHKGIGALVVDSKNKIFVHKRSKMKKVFPSMLDMFIGGVSGEDELPVETLRREINEEIGVELFKQEKADELFKAYTKVNSRTHRNLFFKSHRLSGAVNSSNAAVCSDSINAINGTDLEMEYQNFKDDEMKKRASIVPGNQIYKLGRTICQTNYNHCLVDIYCVTMDDVSSQSIAFRDGEIESGEWLSFSELIQKLSDGGRQKFVPDGLQVWDALILNKLERE